MQKIFKTFIYTIISVVLVLILLPTSSQAIYIVADGGGSGITSGGNGGAGGGAWSQSMQGLRITILDSQGNPVFYYGQSDKTSDCKT